MHFPQNLKEFQAKSANDGTGRVRMAHSGIHSSERDLRTSGEQMEGGPPPPPPVHSVPFCPHNRQLVSPQSSLVPGTMPDL